MKILIVGSGGREHAICWKVSRSPKLKKLYVAPGNGGMSSIAEIVDVKADDIAGLIEFAKIKKIDLTIVGPEAPLVAGIVDSFEKNNLKIFGPNKESARIEGSKVYAKKLLSKFGVPTADFKIFDDARRAKEHVEKINAPVVVKADGLAAGKGVFVCKTRDEAIGALDYVMVKKAFGSSGDRAIVEERLEGEEASIIVISDGKNVLPLASSQDHKRIFDNDLGANTGGMGAYSPAPAAEGRVFEDTLQTIVRPVIEGLAKEGNPFKGVLYAGIMITPEGPKVLEFNVRLGDPETQAMLPRLKTDLVELIELSLEERLNEAVADWDERACACVVMASGGYPGKYEKDKEISGLEEAGGIKDVLVFHAGTRRENGKILTSGGRVLGVTALGEDLKAALKSAYSAVEKIKFDGAHYRKDIGRRALCREGNH